MIKIKSILFALLAVILLVSSSVQAAEEAAPHSGIASRLAQSEAFVSPFQVIVDQSGQLTVKPRSIFSEGAQDPQLELPQLLNSPKPMPLPAWALSQKSEGEVVLAVAVKTDGTVGETMVMEPSGHDALDQWARDLVQSWHFRPAMKEGKAVYECIQIPIQFKLEPIE